MNGRQRRQVGPKHSAQHLQYRAGGGSGEIRAARADTIATVEFLSRHQVQSGGSAPLGRPHQRIAPGGTREHQVGAGIAEQIVRFQNALEP